MTAEPRLISQSTSPVSSSKARKRPLTSPPNTSPPPVATSDIVGEEATASSRELADWLAKDGQLLIPLVELLEKGERAHRRGDRRHGRATVEAVLQMSTEQVAGPKAQGRRGTELELPSGWQGKKLPRARKLC